MNNRPRRFRALGVVLATAFASTAAIAATVPLRATIVFNEQVAPVGPPCSLTGTISGESTASNVGPLQIASGDCINPVSATKFLFVSDHVVLTTGDGNQIFAAYGGTLTATTGAIQGAYFIFGGTGRFKNASGVGRISGFESVDFQRAVGTGMIDLDGTLTY